MTSDEQVAVDRTARLVTVAELYHRDGLTQQQIADRMGINRSSISRLLTEAGDAGIVKVSIEVPLTLDRRQANAIGRLFPSLEQVSVVRCPRPGDLFDGLGRAGAALLEEMIGPESTVGVTWGRSVSAVVEAMPVTPVGSVTVVQLAGALGMSESGDPRTVAETLASRFGASLFLLNTPLVVESPEVAVALQKDAANRATLRAAAAADVILIGVGIADETNSSLLSSGHLSRRDLRVLIDRGAIGDAGGHPVDDQGRSPDRNFDRRLVSLSRRTVLRVPNRIIVAGGPSKAQVLRAAIAGGFATHLVIDSSLADALVAADAT